MLWRNQPLQHAAAFRHAWPTRAPPLGSLSLPSVAVTRLPLTLTPDPVCPSTDPLCSLPRPLPLPCSHLPLAAPCSYQSLCHSWPIQNFNKKHARVWVRRGCKALVGRRRPTRQRSAPGAGRHPSARSDQGAPAASRRCTTLAERARSENGPLISGQPHSGRASGSGAGVCPPCCLANTTSEGTAAMAEQGQPAQAPAVVGLAAGASHSLVLLRE